MQPTTDNHTRSRSHHDKDSAPSFNHALRSENTDLAYVLGAFAATTEIGTASPGRISFSSTENTRLELIRARFVSLLGTAPAAFDMDVHGNAYKRFTICNDEIANHFFSITKNNTRVPWEHLGKTEIPHYLRGIFDHAGTITPDRKQGITIRKSDGEELLQDLSRAFLRIGIAPLFCGGTPPALRLLQQNEWERFEKKVGVSLQADKQNLEALCALPIKCRVYTVHDYETVMKEWRSGTPADVIPRITAIGRCSVNDWICGRSIPRAARRHYQAVEAAAAMPNPEVISQVYRVLGGSSECARACATRYAPEKVADLVARQKAHHSPLFTNDHEIFSALESSAS